MNIGLNICLETVCSLVQKPIQKLGISGGATSSIFPKAELMLFNDSTNMKALFWLTGKKNTAYRSVIDFLFCESFPNFKRFCFEFYNNEGPALCDIITIESIKIAGEILVKIVKTCRELYEQNGPFNKWLDVLMIHSKDLENADIKIIIREEAVS